MRMLRRRSLEHMGGWVAQGGMGADFFRMMGERGFELRDITDTPPVRDAMADVGYEAVRPDI